MDAATDTVPRFEKRYGVSFGLEIQCCHQTGRSSADDCDVDTRYFPLVMPYGLGCLGMVLLPGCAMREELTRIQPAGLGHRL